MAGDARRRKRKTKSSERESEDTIAVSARITVIARTLCEEVWGGYRSPSFAMSFDALCVRGATDFKRPVPLLIDHLTQIRSTTSHRHHRLYMPFTSITRCPCDAAFIVLRRQSHKGWKHSVVSTHLFRQNLCLHSLLSVASHAQQSVSSLQSTNPTDSRY